MEFKELIEASMIKKEDALAMVNLAKKQNISKHSFLSDTLAKRNLVDQKLLDNILKEFDKLDTNSDGSLDYGEILAWLEVDEKKRKKLMEKNIQRKDNPWIFSISRLKANYKFNRKKKMIEAKNKIDVTVHREIT